MMALVPSEFDKVPHMVPEGWGVAIDTAEQVAVARFARAVMVTVARVAIVSNSICAIAPDEKLVIAIAKLSKCFIFEKGICDRQMHSRM